MRRSTRMRRTAMATVVGAAAALAPVWMARAGERAPPAGSPAAEFEPMRAPGLLAGESGVPPPALRLRAIVARAWEDSISTWKRLMGPQAADVEMVHLRFVARLVPTNCYGLYAGEGPTYCSGNSTVFVGTNAASRLMAKLGPHGEAGITFLIGHEIGHHIQNIYGRFHALNHMLARLPEMRADLVRRFELEADCFAGVSMHSNSAWTESAHFRSELLAVMGSIGDEAMLGRAAEKDSRALVAVHGTSEQRSRSFLRGAESGNIEACNMFSAPER